MRKSLYAIILMLSVLLSFVSCDKDNDITNPQSSENKDEYYVRYELE